MTSHRDCESTREVVRKDHHIRTQTLTNTDAPPRHGKAPLQLDSRSTNNGKQNLPPPKHHQGLSKHPFHETAAATTTATKTHHHPNTTKACQSTLSTTQPQEQQHSPKLTSASTPPKPLKEALLPAINHNHPHHQNPATLI